jgi:hypothetical protein
MFDTAVAQQPPLNEVKLGYLLARGFEIKPTGSGSGFWVLQKSDLAYLCDTSYVKLPTSNPQSAGLALGKFVRCGRIRATDE